MPSNFSPTMPDEEEDFCNVCHTVPGETFHDLTGQWVCYNCEDELDDMDDDFDYGLYAEDLDD